MTHTHPILFRLNNNIYKCNATHTSTGFSLRSLLLLVRLVVYTVTLSCLQLSLYRFIINKTVVDIYRFCLQLSLYRLIINKQRSGLLQLFHFHHTAFSSQIKCKVGNILPKSVTLRINLNIDGSPLVSKSHTHPSHSQTSCLLTSSLFLGVPVPHGTQCIRVV